VPQSSISEYLAHRTVLNMLACLPSGSNAAAVICGQNRKKIDSKVQKLSLVRDKLPLLYTFRKKAESPCRHALAAFGAVYDGPWPEVWQAASVSEPLRLISGPVSCIRQLDGGKVLLREQPFQVLRTLIESGGKIVTRDEIKKKLWPNEHDCGFRSQHQCRHRRPSARPRRFCC